MAVAPAPPPTPEEAASLIGWLHDWASWIIAGLGAASAAVTLVWRHSGEIASDKARHTEDRASIAALSARVFALEAEGRAMAIKLAGIDAITASIAGSIAEIRASLARIEGRVDEALTRHV